MSHLKTADYKSLMRTESSKALRTQNEDVEWGSDQTIKGSQSWGKALNNTTEGCVGAEDNDEQLRARIDPK